ncbi:MAG: ATP-binding cassette domain-containing protein [Rhodospirillaceae bacterium]
MLRYTRGRALAHVGGRIEFIVGGGIFQRLLALPIAFTEQVSIGSQIARLKDFETLREAFVGPFALFIYELPATLIYVAALAIVNIWLFMILVLSGVAYLVLGMATHSTLSERLASASRMTTDRQEFLIELLSRMRTVKFVGAEGLWYERFRALSAKSHECELHAQRFAGLISLLSQLVANFTSVAVLVTLVLVSLSSTVSPGAVVVSMILTFRLMGPLQGSFMSLATMFRVVRSVRQIDNLMKLRVERNPSEPIQSPPVFKGEVLFNRVSFRYGNEADPALLGVSVRIPPGHVAAIAGRNGAGKSTLMKLITGIYQPQAGSVRLDNIDIRQLDPLELRSVISYAPQRCDIFYGTIAQNLRLVHPSASDEELRWAADMVGLTEDVMSLPHGFETRISDTQGGQLPHGFRQRLSLARACVRPAPVVLFDEPGNGLDSAGDQAFVNAVGWLRRRSTIFIVSHRPSHLKLADVVIFLEDGYVRQIGSFEQLNELIMGTLS